MLRKLRGKESLSKERKRKEVYEEVVTRGGNLFGAEEVESAEWIKVEKVKNRIAVESLSIALDKGEAEAIVLAREKEYKRILSLNKTLSYKL